MPNPGQGSQQPSGIRTEVLALRNARDANARQNAAEHLRTALLTAAHADEALDGMLLGMAAAQCAKHGLSDLMGLLCAYATCRLESYGSREVAEMVSAATKLGCAEPGFLRAVVAFCATPAEGLFVSSRDVGMVANALLHSLRQDNFRGVRGSRDHQMRSSINHEAGLLGLAEAAIPNLQDRAPVRDLAELAHVFGHALEVQVSGEAQVNSGEALHTRPAVRKVIRVAVEQFRAGIHLASARDATMTAGAIAAAWTYMEPDREVVFGPCLVDIAQFARFRRTDFNPQDLSLLALAFSKTEVATADLMDVLNEQVVARITEFSNKDLVLLLDASVRTESWMQSYFVETAAAAVSQCRLAEFPAQDLSSLAHSLAILGASGKQSLQKIAGEAFRRQLCSFSSKDKAVLLLALAKASSKEVALLRILVRALGIEDCTILDKDTVASTLWALAQVWKQLPEGDRWSQSLLSSLCSTCPWNVAAASEVCKMAWALGQFPTQLETEVWGSFMASAEKLPPDACTMHELCSLLSGLSRSPRSHWFYGESLADRFLAEIARKMQDDATSFEAADVRLLAEAIRRCEWNVPEDLSQFIAESDTAASESQEECTSTIDGFITPAPADVRSRSPTPEPSEDSRYKTRGGARSTSPTQAWLGEEKPTVEIEELESCDHGAGLRFTEPQERIGRVQECNDGDRSPTPPFSDEDGVHEAFRHTWLGKQAASDQGQSSEKSDEDPTSTSSQKVVCTPYAQAAGQADHGVAGDPSSHHACCPTIINSDSFGHVRLNPHCDFSGHCIQIKNTFLHMSCSHGAESEDKDCVVCKMTRSRSLGDMRGHGSGNLDGLLENLQHSATSAGHHNARARGAHGIREGSSPIRGGRLSAAYTRARRGGAGSREVRGQAVQDNHAQEDKSDDLVFQ